MFCSSSASILACVEAEGRKESQDMLQRRNHTLEACATAVAQASLLALRPKASKNRRICHYAAITSWKHVLHCYKLEACATLLQAGSLCYIRVHPWLIKNNRITDRGMAVTPARRCINHQKPSACSAPLREKKIPLLLRLRLRLAPRNDGESIRGPSARIRCKFTNRCHPAAATSWKLVLHCYKLEACATAVAQASLLAMRPKASKNRRIYHNAAITSWKHVLHPRSIRGG